MHELLNDGWKYSPESLDEMSVRYNGFGSKLFEVILADLPEYYVGFQFYRATQYQTEDVFAICTGLGHDFGIQLDPDCEVICLWDNKVHIEIGYWSENEYKESIEFIKSNFGY